MLTESNNVIAENLARHVALATGAAASFSAAARAETAVLRRLGAATGVHLVDGSGLSPLDRIPAATLVRLVSVDASARHPQLRAASTGMPVAGFSGTLAAGGSVFGGGLAPRTRGLVRAKTGTWTRWSASPGWSTTGAGPCWPSRSWPTRFRAAVLAAGRGRDRPARQRADRVRLPVSSGLRASPSPGLAGEPPRPAGPSLDVSGRRAPRGTYGGGMSSPQMIDWDVAIATGVRWVRPGPQISMTEARRAVTELRDLADAVRGPVRELTGLRSPETAGQVAVVDRPGWIRANVDGFRVVLDPLVTRLAERGSVPAAGRWSRRWDPG